MNSPWQQQYKGRNWTADKRPKSKKKPSFFYFASSPSLLDGSRDCMPYLEASLASTSTTQESHILFYGQAARHTHKKGGKLTCYNGLWWPFDPIESISCDAETTTRFSNKESIGREFEQKLTAAEKEIKRYWSSNSINFSNSVDLH